MSVADLKRYLRMIATALHANAWSVQQAKLLIGEPLHNWRWTGCEELSHLEPGSELLTLEEMPSWRPELVFGALADHWGTHADPLTNGHSADGPTPDGPTPCGICWPPGPVIEHGKERLLGWATIEDSGNCCCFVFLRSVAASGFTAQDAATLAVLAEELLRPRSVMEATATACPQPELSPRQHDVLDRLLLGLTVKEVARDLKLSPHTVNDYVRALYKRYKVSSRGELMAVVHGHRKPQMQ